MTDLVGAQDLRKRYEHAERLLPHRWGDLQLSGRVTPNWIGASDRFWYLRRTAAGKEWMIVDPDAELHVPAFDRAALAAAWGGVADPQKLPVVGLEVQSDDTLRLHIDGQTWLWDAAAATLTQTTLAAPRPFIDAPSPDGRLLASVRDYNLVVLDRGSGVERALTTDGRAAYGYGDQPDLSSSRFTLDLVGLRMPPAICWSPDSRRLVAHRIDQRELPLMHYVQSLPPGGGRPRLFSERYAMVGDRCPVADLVVIDVEDETLTFAKAPPIEVRFLAPITARHVWWDHAGEYVYFLAPERGDRTIRLYRLDPETGDTHLLVEESNGTQVQVHPLLGRPNVHVLTTGEIIWWSERDGWGHLYLYGQTGEARQLTSGNWLVRELVQVDERSRTLLFSASSREPGLDPYVRQLYRLDFDTGQIERLSSDRLDHDVGRSPSGDYVLDVASWLDVPDQSSLLNKDGRVVLELARGDATALYAAGWTPPERFTVKAADGTTDLYGLLYRPAEYSPEGCYPILDDIYPGPQIGAATVRFCQRGTAEHAASMAALGFAVVVVDGRGTPLRGKAFQEWCRAEHDGDYLDDHVAAIRHLAAERPWLDLDRIGIYGHSGGGRASTLALLRRPEFFKVAVSRAGNHDDALYHPGWGEKYIGLPGEVDYRIHANATYVDRLRGKLLLIHGELDNNVHPYMTLQLVDALMAADKDFDLLIAPNADHGLRVHAEHLLRRRWDYFVRHLMFVEPPQYHIAKIAIDFESLVEAFA